MRRATTDSGVTRKNRRDKVRHKHKLSEAFMNRISRRHFLRGTTASVALPWIVPSSVFGAEAPSNKITVGFIGVGSHGVDWNLSKYLKLPASKVVMVCDVDGCRMRKAKAMVDAKYDNEDCAMTKDFREVLARKDIDAVMISTPDHWHTLISLLAIRAGKDVQCEKPTLTIDEGKVLIETVRKHKKVFQTSTEDRSVPEYHRMAELVRNGRIGKLQRIEVILPKQPNGPGDPTPQPVPPELDYEMWLGPAPYAPYTKDRVHFNFRWIWDYSGGIICDWGAHLFDTAQWANNTERSGPVEVEGTGTYWEGGLYNTVKDYDVTYRYANGVVMTCKPGNPSIKFIGTEGWVGNTGWRGPVQASSRPDPRIEDRARGTPSLHQPRRRARRLSEMRQEPQRSLFPSGYWAPRFHRLPPGQHRHQARAQTEVGPAGRAFHQ